MLPRVQKGGEEWNIINGYFRGVSIHRHRFATPVRAGSVLSVSLLDKNDFLHVWLFKKKVLSCFICFLFKVPHSSGF